MRHVIYLGLLALLAIAFTPVSANRFLASKSKQPAGGPPNGTAPGNFTGFNGTAPPNDTFHNGTDHPNGTFPNGTALPPPPNNGTLPPNATNATKTKKNKKNKTASSSGRLLKSKGGKGNATFNGTAPPNDTHPHGNGTFNGTFNGTRPEFNGTFNGTHPDFNGTRPEFNGSFNGTLPPNATNGAKGGKGGKGGKGTLRALLAEKAGTPPAGTPPARPPRNGTDFAPPADGTAPPAKPTGEPPADGEAPPPHPEDEDNEE